CYVPIKIVCILYLFRFQANGWQNYGAACAMLYASLLSLLIARRFLVFAGCSMWYIDLGFALQTKNLLVCKLYNSPEVTLKTWETIMCICLFFLLPFLCVQACAYYLYRLCVN